MQNQDTLQKELEKLVERRAIRDRQYQQFRAGSYQRVQQTETYPPSPNIPVLSNMLTSMVFPAGGLFFQHEELFKASNKKRVEPKEDENLDLFGGSMLSKKFGRCDFDPVVPFNAMLSGSSYPLYTLDVSRLPQTHVIDVLNRNYLNKYHEVDTSCISLSDCVSSVQRNVGALSENKGRAYASGILIAPNLFLTARHAVEKKLPREVMIRLGYQRHSCELFHGNFYEISGLVEECEDLDYAILLLKKPIRNFKPLSIELNNQVAGNTIFIHHPNGGPKMVSVHASMESEHYQLSYQSFHDTDKGSSGAPYFSLSPKIFGLHLLKDGTTGVRWIKDIYDKSQILNKLYDTRGKYKIREGYMLTRMNLVPMPLALGKFSKEHIRAIERVDKPAGFEAQFVLPFLGSARHHIIPAGDMGFLWFMGEENINIKRLLQNISYQQLGTIESVEWAPWNLFIGPDNRHEDPGEDLECRRPLSYPENLWTQIQDLYQKIQICWEARKNLSTAMANTTLTGFRSSQIGEIELGRGVILNAKKEYLAAQRGLFEPLCEISKIVTRSNIVLHPHNANDWTLRRDGKFSLKTGEPKPRRT